MKFLLEIHQHDGRSFSANPVGGLSPQSDPKGPFSCVSIFAGVFFCWGASSCFLLCSSGLWVGISLWDVHSIVRFFKKRTSEGGVLLRPQRFPFSAQGALGVSSGALSSWPLVSPVWRGIRGKNGAA